MIRIPTSLRRDSRSQALFAYCVSPWSPQIVFAVPLGALPSNVLHEYEHTLLNGSQGLTPTSGSEKKKLIPLKNPYK